jgi:flagellar biosynthetic protein FlhB
MAHGDKTEQATPRRREKAREQGQVARSRELPAAVAGFAALMVLLWVSAAQMSVWRQDFRQWLEVASASDMTVATAIPRSAAGLALRWSALPLLAALALSVLLSVAQGGLVFAGAALQPKLDRLNPVTRLGQMFSAAGLSSPAKSLIPFSVLIYLDIAILLRDWGRFTRPLPGSAMAELLYRDGLEVAWKATLTLLVWAAADYLLQWRRMENQLRMSRQELREEYKETDGNPSVKARIRRLQRQLRRRRVLKDVQRAAVVVTNPTHFAVALEYRPDMAAPRVLAKGRNQLAEQIKRVAYWHEVPVMENRPLAQALYRSVEVGQSIPAKLYVAVAELLAYVYRAQMRAQTAGYGGRA